MNIIYHNADLDGKASCAIARKCKSINISKIFAMNYGYDFSEIMKIKNEEIMFLDFTIQPYELMFELAKNNKLTIIDHHISAYKELNRINADYMYSEKNAGCELTWIDLIKTPVPLSVQYLSAYDIFDKKRFVWDDVLAFQYGVRVENPNPETDEGMNYFSRLFTDENMNDIIKIGRPILDYQKEQNINLMKKSFDLEFDGLKCLCVNGGQGSMTFESRWDNKKYDAMLSFSNINNKHWSISLYTDKDIDLTITAKKYGGGGHKQACGFQVEDINTILRSK